jgi:fatty-acid peroxygenase
MGQPEVVLFDEAEELLCRAACEWAGAPLAETEVTRRTHEMTAMIDAPAALGLRYWRGRRARQRAEGWARDLVERVRAGGLDTPEGSALRVIATHRGLDGALLDTQIAAVELLNIIRPTVAVARFITFAALALHEHPECRKRIEADEAYLEWFVQEVRRYYPFFPLVVARASRDFEWRGERLPQGHKVILDLYATDHDARLWDDPEEFRPERFRDWDGDAFDFIPQGGGDHLTGHRCPGESPTIELMKVAVRFLVTSMEYKVPAQDLSVSLSRIPAEPKSRFVIGAVRPR